MSPVLREQVEAVLGVLDITIGSHLTGTYLYGSAVEGGLKPDSDLDLFGVIQRRLKIDERRQIVEGLLPLSGRATRLPSWRPIELTLVVRDELVPWRYPPRFDLQYGEWLRPAFLAGDLEPWPAANPDLAVLVTMVIRHSEPLRGPPAGDLLVPVPHRDLLRAMTDELRPLLEDLETDTRNVLLTLARMWMTATTGDVASKDVAARWAMARLADAHRPPLATARAGYLGEVDERWDDLEAARATANELRTRLETTARPLPQADASV